MIEIIGDTHKRAHMASSQAATGVVVAIPAACAR